MKRQLFNLLLLITFFFSTSNVLANDKKFEISKNIDIYTSLLRELDLFYVDTIQVEKIIKSSIDEMLQGLDPYTVYIPEKETNDFKFLTTGEYGGIGSMISQNENQQIFFSEPYEGMPAQKIGIKAGDVIIEIDGVKIKGKTVSDVSSMLKGQPGTTVKVKIERPFEKAILTKEITREKIQINPVSYYGVVGKNTGYILLNSFTDKASEEVKKAFLDLKKKHQIKLLILDLRDNPGGIIDEAVNITNFFIPKGQDVVSTKGKVKQWDDVYKSKNEPLDAEIPLLLLVNANSASASEIVAGALQDLDRAVLVGNRTFGKGLVQATREVSYNGYLKVTTAKYYTPSGRCIQAIDYAHKNEDGSSTRIPDSLTTAFKTKNGRIVRDGGGITPDVQLQDNKKLTITYYLLAKNMIFDFATEYVHKNKRISSPEEFTITDSEYQEFKQFLKNRNFTYKLKSTELLNRLKEYAKIEGYAEISSEQFDALEKVLSPNIDKDVDLFKKDIVELLNAEIVKRYFYQKGEVRYILKNDEGLKKAVEVLENNEEYIRLLSTPAKK